MSTCRREGHTLNAVIAKTAHGFRRLKYQICCRKDSGTRFDEKSERRRKLIARPMIRKLGVLTEVALTF